MKSQGRGSISPEAEGEEQDEMTSRQRKICWDPVPAEKNANAPNQGALLQENDIRFEITKLDCVQGPLPCNEIHKGVEIIREVGKWTRDQDKIFAIRHEFLDKSRARMTGIKILCTLFEIVFFCHH